MLQFRRGLTRKGFDRYFGTLYGWCTKKETCYS